MEAKTIMQAHEEILRYLKNKNCSILEIGASNYRNPAWKEIRGLAQEYVATDIATGRFPAIIADVCNMPQIADSQYDVVLALNVFEHIKTPWVAAKECMRVLKSGGLVIVESPFAWYYHCTPNDFWRFTPDGLETLFVGTENCTTYLKCFKDILWEEKRATLKTSGITSIFVGIKK